MEICMAINKQMEVQVICKMLKVLNQKEVKLSDDIIEFRLFQKS